MDDLAAFIAARLDEDEACVYAEGTPPHGVIAWLTFEDPGGRLRYTTVAHGSHEDAPWIADGREVTPSRPPLVVHDARQVLRDVEFGRWLLAEHSPEPGLLSRQLCRACWGRVRINGVPSGPGRYPCQTLRRYAARWGTHPGYPVGYPPEDEARA